MEQHRLDALLTRALADDSNEADNAWRLLKAAMRKAPNPRVLAMDREYRNPLLFVVQQADEDNARLRETVASLTARLQRIRRAAEIGGG